MLPLAAEHRDEALRVLNSGVKQYNGGFLYHPMLLAVSDLANLDAMVRANAVPGTRFSSRISAATMPWEPITPAWILDMEKTMRHDKAAITTLAVWGK